MAEGYKMGLKESKISENISMSKTKKEILERFSAINKYRIDIKRGLMSMDEESAKMLRDSLNELINAAHGY